MSIQENIPNRRVIRVHDGMKLRKDNGSIKKFKPEKQGSFWGKTQVIVGHGLRQNKFGIHTLDEVKSDVPNMVPIGGVQYAMRNLFQIAGPVMIPTLYDLEGIGLPNPVAPTTTFSTPDGNQVIQYQHGQMVCLFGVGITGGGENAITKYDVNYRERSITMNRLQQDGTNLQGIMIPFRYTSSVLSTTDKKKYFGKKSMPNSNTAYYLKRFESQPIIHHVWKTGDELGNEIEITPAEVWDMSRTDIVETFTEFILEISAADVKEYFAINDQADSARINSIAIYTAKYNATLEDYENVTLFSKLNIPIESLSLNKDLQIIYRVWGN